MTFWSLQLGEEMIYSCRSSSSVVVTVVDCAGLGGLLKEEHEEYDSGDYCGGKIVSKPPEFAGLGKYCCCVVISQFNLKPKHAYFLLHCSLSISSSQISLFHSHFFAKYGKPILWFFDANVCVITSYASLTNELSHLLFLDGTVVPRKFWGNKIFF